ncbi:MAG: MoxR family ATPase [Actinobacteria bacterium]|nr:MoxR family ATPase [Actinomycetota bacterium]
MFGTSPMSPNPDAVTRERLEAVLYEMRRVIVGQDHLLDRLVVALLSRGHVLVEGVPGLAKTLTLETTARVCGGVFARIQFTPDLVPGDVVGGQILDREHGGLATRLGPVFANFVLADEINRAPAKVQSALLEVMAEGHASIAGETHAVPDPFFVLATQNPIESEGVYALPEAQLDRFAMKVVVGYPSKADEEEIVRRMAASPPVANQLMDPAEILALQETADRVFVDHRVRAYAVRLVNATRSPAEEGIPNLAPYLELGGSPRASLALVRGARALAVMRGRGYVLPEDVHSLFHDALRHRIVLSYEALAASVRPDQVLDEIVATVPVPAVEIGADRAVA